MDTHSCLRSRVHVRARTCVPSVYANGRPSVCTRVGITTITSPLSGNPARISLLIVRERHYGFQPVLFCRKNKEDTIQAIRDLRYRRAQKTNTQAALALATSDVFTRRNGDRDLADNAIILITDGRSNVVEHRTIPEANRLKDAGVRIVTVGVTHLIDENELRSISSPPHLRNRFVE